MTGLAPGKRGERGMSAIAVVFAIGVVVITIGIAVLLGTDAQIRGSFLGQMKRDSDWTARAAVKLTEEGWQRYAGITPVEGALNPFTGTIFNAVNLLSRENDLIWAINQAINQGQDDLSLLPLTFDWMVQNDQENRNVQTEVPHPTQYAFQVDLRPGGVSTDTDGDGIVPYDPATQPQIWNSIDANNTRQFNAVITVMPNGAPHYSTDNVFYVFPVRFELTLTTMNAGLQDGRSVNRTVAGLGSCAFYLYRRSFAEYVMFADKFETETGGPGSIQLPKDFTYGGPVHTNTEFYFTGNPSTHFLDRVSSVCQTAMYGSPSRHLDAISYIDTGNPANSVIPTFDNGFYRGASEIQPPSNLGDVKGGVLAGRPEPGTLGVHLPVTDDTLDRGGIYIKGDVQSLTLSQGNRQQTYVITQNTAAGATTQVIEYSNFTSGHAGDPNYARTKTVTDTTPVIVATYTITCDYDGNTTSWRKDATTNTKTVISVYTRTTVGPGVPWPSTPSKPPKITIGPTETTLPTETQTYTGVIDAIENEGDETRPVEQQRKQPAIYIDGDLGLLSDHTSYDTNGYPTGARLADGDPSGLSGTLDRDTELTICAKGKIVITEDTKYENHGHWEDDPAKNVLGLLSETSKVFINYVEPEGNSVEIDASIMAIHDDETDPDPLYDGAAYRGVLTAYEYKLAHGIDPVTGQKPAINLYGGVIQAYYGAVGQSGDNGYLRNFLYDPRLKTAPPPFYPQQSACQMQLLNEQNQNTLQLVWKY